MIDAVLLDLGNVLVFHDNALLFRRIGERAALPEAEVGRRLTGDLWTAINTGALDEEGIRHEMNQALGTRLDAADFFQLFNSHFTVHEEVLPLVERLLGRVKVALLSNTNAVHARWVRARLPLLERFDAVLLSNQEGLVKPDPAFYRRALDRLGTRPARTVFFDDVPEYVAAARALGIRAEVFTTAGAFARALAESGLEISRLR
ncbi:MAG TPA: HAD family phosphatase [Myxococcales bacterium]|nr:HAD family phosphatase [Myxococcales bacterium]